MIFRNFVLQNFPFLEDDFDALTDYELFCKMVEYMKKSLDKITEYQGELSEFRAELDTYKTYFDNLDLQEEVDNKLDEMLEDGTLENLIGQYIQLATTYVYNNVNEMVNAENLVNGSFARTSGFYAYNDGGGANYKIRTITNEDVINDMNLFALVNDNTLVAELIDNDINVKQLGAYGDNENDDTSVLQFAIDNYKNIFIPKGTYLISTSLKLKDNVIINGENLINTKIVTEDDINIFENGTSCNYTTIRNLTLYTEDTSTKYAIDIKGSITSPYTGATYSLFENITVNGFYSGIFLNHVWNTNINNFRVVNSTDRGIFLGGGCNNVIIDKPILEHLNIGIRLTTSDGDTTQNTNISIRNADLEYCDDGIYSYNMETVNITDLYSEHNTRVIYGYGTKALKVDGFYSSMDTKLCEFTNTGSTVCNGFIRINNNSDVGIISTNQYIDMYNITGANDGSGKIFLIANDVNSYIPSYYSTLPYNIESESFRLRYSSDNYSGTFNSKEKNGNQYFCYKPCLLVTSNTLTANSNDTIQLKRNDNTVASLTIANGEVMTNGNIYEFTAGSTSAKTFIYNNGDTYSITHTNTTGVDVNFKVVFRNIKTGRFIIN